MKIAISGKGGVGKTTLAGVMARILAKRGRKVLAIDADPDSNLASAIGLPKEALAKLDTLLSLFPKGINWRLAKPWNISFWDIRDGYREKQLRKL